MNSRGKLFKFTNFLYYVFEVFERNNWMFDIRRHFSDFSFVEIDRPLFLLRTQGGGLTLISRMLRRNRDVASVTGDSECWTGADEMQNVLGLIIPKELTGIKHKAPPDKIFDTPGGWLYATDRLVKKYRNDTPDVDPDLETRVRKILRWVIARQAGDKDVRFTDKSQLYTIKVAFLNIILEEHDPKFVLVIRNPYAVCYRSAKGKARSLKLLEKEFDLNKRIEFAAQHWANSMKYALQDRSEIDNFVTFRFEDVLQEPEATVKSLCNCVKLDFDRDMLPQPDHEIPFGSRYYKRWYPLRPGVNEKYLEQMKREQVQIIDSYCGDLAEEFGYKKPE